MEAHLGVMRPVLAGLLVLGLPVLASAGFTPVAAELEVPLQNSTGATFVDLDRDGNLDLVAHDARVWLGQGDGTFVAGPSCEVTGAPVVADFDNDGYLDVLRVSDEPVICWGSESGELVADLDAVEPSPYAGAHHAGNQLAYDAVALDLDGDGWLDLYLSNYEDHLAPEQPNTFVPYPDLFYLNDGRGGLEILGEAPTGKIFQNRGATVGDFDDDGDPDIYVSSYRSNRNLLWRNEKGTGVSEVAEEVDAHGWGHTISSTFADLDGDGALDIVVGNLAHPGQPSIATLLNRVAETGAFFDPGEAHGIPWVESFASVATGDHDNDGDLDLFITAVYDGDWGKLFQNDGSAFFTDVTAAQGLTQRKGYGVAWGDVNGDGAQDLFLGGAEASHLFLNAAGQGRFVRLRLRGDGKKVNDAAVGARVTAYVGDSVLVREIQAGGSGGDRGSNEMVVHLGLGDLADDTLELDVRWPWAETCTYTVDVDVVTELTYDPQDPACAGVGGTGGSTGGDDGGNGSGTGGDVPGSTSGDGDATGGSTGGGAPAGGDGSDGGCGCRSGGEGVPFGTGLVVLLLGVGRRR